MKYFGIESDRELKPVDETLVKFDTGTDEWLYVSKQSTEVEADGRTMKLKLGAWVYSKSPEYGSSCDKAVPYGVQLCLIPDASTIGPKLRKSIADTHGYADRDKVDEYDAYQCGYCINLPFAAHLLSVKNGVNNPRVQKILGFVGTVAVDAIFGMIGFHVDRQVNRVGRTGWDEVKEWLE